ncbi:MAG: HK97 family phage prohead protease, partial [Chitinophagaceae bacterium]|nr:HK97 family phage prohead protease [Chitinophagaceae bacterium]
MEQFSSKTMSEVYDLKFDFTDYLSDEDEIVFGSTEVKILSGKDPKYKQLLYGHVLQKGNVLSQRVQGGKVGVVYKITVTAETAKRQVLKLSGSLEIAPDLSIDEEIVEAVIAEPIATEPQVQVKSPPIVENKTFNFLPTEVKEIERDGVRYGRIAGYASTFGNVDRVGDVVVQGAFKDSITSFKQDNRPVRMLYQHDGCELIGGFIPGLMFEDSQGLFVEGEINLAVQRGAEAYALAKQGVLTDMSIGYSVEDFELKDGVRYLTAIRLWEISLVSEPANPKAKITAVKTVDELRESIKKKSDLEKVLRDAGFS